jgi:hypothetical protein
VYGFGYGVGYFKVKYPKGDEVEHGSPNHSLKRSEHFGRNNCGYRVGSVVKTIDQIESQSEYNNYN